MEPQESQLQHSCLFDYLLHTSQHDLINCTLQFLDLEELNMMAGIGLGANSNSKLFKVAIVKTIMGKYLNKVDRSVFFLFYQDQDFLSIEKNTINSLANQDLSFLRQTYYGYHRLLEAFKDSTSFLNSQPQFQNLIELLFLEPDLPMPKFKRETIGMFCQTGFQDLLCLVKFPPEEAEEVWMEEPLEQLRDIVAEQLIQLTHNNLIYDEHSPEQVTSKIRNVRFCGYKVNQHNWKSYLLENFKMHNILVLMLGFCSHMVSTFSQIINYIEDPFMRFAQFSLRANIYRNVVLSIEQKFNFLFQDYSEFYTSAFKPSPKYPPMNFWRPALSIWTQQMKHFHPSNEKAYNYIVSKLRQNNLKQFLAIKTQKLPSFFSELKREVDLQTFSHKRQQQFYTSTQNQIQMQAYFQNNTEMYETLAKDYIEYMVDISLNDYTVHWCGHSEHVIKNYHLFSKFIHNIVTESSEMYDFLNTIIKRSVPKQISLNIFKEVVKEDLSFADQRLFKPCIIKEIMEEVNGWIQHQVVQLSQYAVFHEEGYSKHKISIDFNEKDGILSYFSNKYEIQEDCPKELSFFYNIQIEDTEPTFIKEKEDEEENLQNMEQYNSDEEEMVPEKQQH